MLIKTIPISQIKENSWNPNEIDEYEFSVLVKNIKDKKKRYQQTLTRCLKAGKEALIIKAADILDNSHYYHLANGKKLRQWLVEKMKHFIDHSEKILKNEAVFKKLQKQYQKISKEI